MGASYRDGQTKAPRAIDQIKKGNPIDGLRLFPRRVAHGVAGLVDGAVDLASGFLGGAFGTARQGKSEEEDGAKSAENGIGVAHGKKATPAVQQSSTRADSPVRAR